MKDLPHHIKKLNRRVVRSIHREETEEEAYDTTPRKQTMAEEKKIAKRALTKKRNDRTPIHLTPEERNREMKFRTPIFDRENAKPRFAKPTRKKTPRI